MIASLTGESVADLTKNKEVGNKSEEFPEVLDQLLAAEMKKQKFNDV